MAQYLKNGNTYRVTSKEAMDLHEQLPAGNFVVKQDQMGNFFLEKVESFDITGKLYGDTLKHTTRILDTFKQRTASTGVMLNGEKGSGKTLLAKNLAFVAAKEGIPTIVINTPWCGDKFNALIQSIDQPCIVLFDEFEKVYSEEDQEKLLTLLDGVFPSKKLFVLTCNNKWRVDKHMRNRPGRIFYMIDFKGLGELFIREYCADKLMNLEHTERLVKIAGTFAEFNFDMLKATVEEMNRYNETPGEAMAILNAKPEFGDNQEFAVKMWGEDGAISGTNSWTGNPLTHCIHLYYNDPKANAKANAAVGTDDDADDNSNGYVDVEFTQADLVGIDGDGIYTFKSKTGLKAVLTKVVAKTYSYHNLI